MTCELDAYLEREFAVNQARLNNLHVAPEPPAVARLLRFWKRLVTTRVSRAEADWICREFPLPLRLFVPSTLALHRLSLVLHARATFQLFTEAFDPPNKLLAGNPP